MQIFSMPFIKSVFRSVPPVAGPLGDAPFDDRIFTQQLAGHVFFDRYRRHGAVEQPDHSRAFFDGVGSYAGFAANLRIWTVGQGGDDFSSLQIERPAVVWTSPSSREFLPATRDADATVRTAIVQGIDAAVLPVEHDALAEQGDRYTLAFREPARLHDRVPVVFE